MDADPSTSVRQLSRTTDVSKTAVHKILREQLLHPYHVQKVHAMSEADYSHRVDFCRAFIENQNNNPEFINIVLFTDEAGFTRNGIINSHNLHTWCDENPHAIVQTKHQQRFIVNVWMGIIGNRLVGPFFINGTLNGQKYLTFLQQDLYPLLEEIPLNIRSSMWLMHDGAPPHFSREVRNFLNDAFPNRWIGRGGPLPWPPRSPDLNPLDFFLWGHLKSLVYSTPVNTREELVHRIIMCSNVLKNNNLQMLSRVKQRVLKNFRTCIQVRGAHIEHLPQT